MIVVAVAAALGLASAGAGAASAAPVTRAPAPVAAAVPSAPVTGTFTDAAGGTGTFTGTFTPAKFVAQNGDLLATGKLTGTLTDSSGTALGTVDQSVNAPVAIAQATCRVLDLVLGPLHLDLLGLTVDLNQLHLVINAVPGPGNLLGNLLCAIAGLLDPVPGAGALAALLTVLLALLGQL
ncbi:hypothetical protein GCM10027087_49240 [Paractinoplanes abujensis]|uniref:Uncharacterized protein n=1 Tax=Paractinoplanes abujensis TaxID=882441 RepID=A0A7W7G273_9ACTN|nr:hypothetical protein [Actinoplanes abujensis]MBB4692860.1 hypothetical protein [Actinoplanes abujensis]